MVAPSPGDARERRLFALLADYLDARDSGRPPELAELVARHPDLARDLCEFAAVQRWLERVTSPVRRVARAARRGESAGRRARGGGAPTPGPV